MVTLLTKEIVRELPNKPGLIITMTPDGIVFKKKRKHKTIFVNWEKILGAAIMKGKNAKTLIHEADYTLEILGFAEEDAAE